MNGASVGPPPVAPPGPSNIDFKVLPKAESAWSGAGDELIEGLAIGEVVYMLNPYFADGTRLRLGPDRDAAFSETHILNDAEVEVLEVTPTPELPTIASPPLPSLASVGLSCRPRPPIPSDRAYAGPATRHASPSRPPIPSGSNPVPDQISDNGFVNVYADEESVEGWVRQRNLTRVRRAQGIKANSVAKQAAAGRSHKLQRGATISNLQAESDGDSHVVKDRDAETAEGLKLLMTRMLPCRRSNGGGGASSTLHQQHTLPAAHCTSSTLYQQHTGLHEQHTTPAAHYTSSTVPVWRSTHMRMAH